jgi:transcriptional regulator with XRE-family HTH domain
MINTGEKLRELRTRKGWTQENVAEMLEMSVSNYSNIEKGKTQVTIPKLAQMAQKLDYDLVELMPLGENVIHIRENNNNGNQAYIIHGSLPNNYQILLAEKEKTDLENTFLKEKIELLEDKIKSLEKIMEMMSEKKP